MSDMMTFPATVEEFMEQYKIVDDEKVYTNGADLVPIFRMMQWFEHVSATDTISRQAAIDALKNDMASLDHIIKGMSAYDVRLDAYVSQRNQVNSDIDTISNLPPAQPEPCEDAVSRKAVKDGFAEMCNLICPYTEKQRHIMCGSCLLGTAFDVLEATQPVTPKQRTGKCMWCERLKERNLRIEYYWIDQEGCTASFSEPHIVATGIAKFCPNCGADMRGEQG